MFPEISNINVEIVETTNDTKGISIPVGSKINVWKSVSFEIGSIKYQVNFNKRVMMLTQSKNTKID
jgi:hypothetical protein